MKKLIALIFAVFVIVACKTAPPPEEPPLPPPPPPPPPPGLENPGFSPELTVAIPELFSPDPDIVDDKMTIAIAVNHPVPIWDWRIEIQPNRAPRQSTQPASEAQASQQPRRQQARQSQRQEGQQSRRAPFYEQYGNDSPPEAWQWNGRSTNGEMVQSATDYRFVLTVKDVFENIATYEGIISVDVLVRREGNILRIIVPSIVFPPNASDFNLLGQDDMAANRRVLRLIAGALNRFADYRVMVEGHANPTTPPNTSERNREETGAANIIGLKPLSESRAKAVVDYLVNTNNIRRDRLSFIGMGGTRTVATYNDDEENWKNRRVEFILEK